MGCIKISLLSLSREAEPKRLDRPDAEQHVGKNFKNTGSAEDERS
jgi:hypothetical protein